MVTFIRRSFGALLAVIVVACMTLTPVSALDVPPKPSDVPIVDQTNTLTKEQINTLATQITAEQSSSGNQLAVLIIPSLNGDSLEEYSLNVARTWGIGTKEHNNGVLLLVAKNDHRLRIEVGYGLEGALTDIQSNQIIQNNITPAFRNGDYFGGIQAGLTSIIQAIHGEYTSTGTSGSSSDAPIGAILYFILFVGFFGISWLASILARSKSWWAGGVIGGVGGGVVGLILGSLLIGALGVVIFAIVGLFFDKMVSDNYRASVGRGGRPSWWAGGGSSGGRSGSGFGGFGGGGFGGGGSSGSW